LDAGKSPADVWRQSLSYQPGVAASRKAALKVVTGANGSNAESEHGANGRQGLEALPPEERSREILNIVLKELDDDKAEEIVTIPLAGKSDIADAMVIASGRSQRHVGAMADKVIRRLKDAGFGRARAEGMPACDWVLIDAEDLIVHLFRPEVRSFYNLERIWSEAARA
jgi:ribosome-associated protein